MVVPVWEQSTVRPWNFQEFVRDALHLLYIETIVRDNGKGGAVTAQYHA